MFFALVYLHTARGLHYGSYKAPRELLWIIRVTILVLMMATAFFGYTLPWGKMSFWGARTTSSHPTIPFLPSPSRRPHIVPEWYLLPYCAILRAIPNKLAGVIAMFGSIGVLFLVPWLDTSRVRSGRFRPVYRVFFWFLIAAWLVLAYCGSKPPEGAYVTVARVAAAYYFATS